MNIIRMLSKLSLATAFSLGTSFSANAGIITQTLLDLYGDFNGDTLTYDFSNLPQSDGTDGTIRIYTGVAQAEPGLFDGLDIDQPQFGEFFTFLIDGNNVGNYACSFAEGVIDLGCSEVTGESDFDVTFNFSDLGLDLSSLLSDSMLSIALDFGSEVDFFFDKDEVFVEISYSSVPEPVSMLGLFLVGSLGLGSLKRKQKA